MEKTIWRRLAERMAPGLMERRVASLGELDYLVAGDRGWRVGGQVVTPQTAMRLSSVWGCVSLLSNIVAGLPLKVYRRNPDGTRQELDPVPSFLAAPSAIVPVEVWRYQMMVSLLLRGNAYGLITATDGAGWPATVEMVNPDSVTVRQENQLAPALYFVGNQEVPRDAVMHVSGWNTPGSVVGMSPIEYARRTIGVGLAATEYAANWYDSGAHPTSLLSSPDFISPDDAKAAKARFKEALAGDSLAVTGSGIKFQAIQVSPAETAWLEAMNATGADVCRFYGVPPQKIGIGVSGEDITYANQEQRNIDFVVNCVQWWVQRVEATLTRMRPRPQYVELDTDNLIRTDLMTRTSVQGELIRSGLRNADELRHDDNLPPIPDGKGKEFLWPPYTVGKVQTDTPGAVQPLKPGETAPPAATPNPAGGVK